MFYFLYFILDIFLVVGKSALCFISVLLVHLLPIFSVQLVTSLSEFWPEDLKLGKQTCGVRIWTLLGSTV